MPLVLFALPNEAKERNDYEIAIPRLGSVVLTHSWDGEIQPLKSVPASERPPVEPVFWAFRVMVGLGTLMLLLALASLWAWRRGRLFESRWLLRRLAPADARPASSRCSRGWYVVEIGRQPYVDLRPAAHRDAVSPNIAGGER